MATSPLPNRGPESGEETSGSITAAVLCSPKPGRSQMATSPLLYQGAQSGEGATTRPPYNVPLQYQGPQVERYHPPPSQPQLSSPPPVLSFLCCRHIPKTWNSKGISRQ